MAELTFTFRDTEPDRERATLVLALLRYLGHGGPELEVHEAQARKLALRTFLTVPRPPAGPEAVTAPLAKAVGLHPAGYWEGWTRAAETVLGRIQAAGAAIVTSTDTSPPRMERSYGLGEASVIAEDVVKQGERGLKASTASFRIESTPAPESVAELWRQVTSGTARQADWETQPPWVQGVRAVRAALGAAENETTFGAIERLKRKATTVPRFAHELLEAAARAFVAWSLGSDIAGAMMNLRPCIERSDPDALPLAEKIERERVFDWERRHGIERGASTSAEVLAEKVRRADAMAAEAAEAAKGTAVQPSPRAPELFAVRTGPEGREIAGVLVPAFKLAEVISHAQTVIEAAGFAVSDVARGHLRRSLEAFCPTGIRETIALLLETAKRVPAAASKEPPSPCGGMTGEELAALAASFNEHSNASPPPAEGIEPPPVVFTKGRAVGKSESSGFTLRARSPEARRAWFEGGQYVALDAARRIRERIAAVEHIVPDAEERRVGLRDALAVLKDFSDRCKLGVLEIAGDGATPPSPPLPSGPDSWRIGFETGLRQLRVRTSQRYEATEAVTVTTRDGSQHIAGQLLALRAVLDDIGDHLGKLDADVPARVLDLDALLHPTGRCTCAGERSCDWCKGPGAVAEARAVALGDWEEVGESRRAGVLWTIDGLIRESSSVWADTWKRARAFLAAYGPVVPDGPADPESDPEESQATGEELAATMAEVQAKLRQPYPPGPAPEGLTLESLGLGHIPDADQGPVPCPGFVVDDASGETSGCAFGYAVRDGRPLPNGLDDCPVCHGEGVVRPPDVPALVGELERLRVQLAGCGVAALGGIGDDQLAKEGDYGWSASYEDVVRLRRSYEAARDDLAEIRRLLSDAGCADDAVVPRMVAKSVKAWEGWMVRAQKAETRAEQFAHRPTFRVSMGERDLCRAGFPLVEEHRHDADGEFPGPRWFVKIASFAWLGSTGPVRWEHPYPPKLALSFESPERAAGAAHRAADECRRARAFLEARPLPEQASETTP